MIELELSKKVLSSILYEDVSFKKALKLVISTNKSGQVKLISGLVGCELRHHLLFESLVTNVDSDEKKTCLYLALANHYFFKRIDEKEINAFLNDHLSIDEIKPLEELLKGEKSPSELISYSNQSLEYASIRFNTPLWLTKMWKKHYGSGNLYKILKANNKQNATYVNLDKNINKDDFLSKNKDSVSFDENSKLFLLSPQVSYKSFEQYKTNNLITINPILNSIFNNLKNDFSNEFTIYSGHDDSFVENIILSTNDNVGLNVVVPTLSNRSSLLRFIRLRKAKNVNLFAAHDEVSMKCGISHKQEIIYCYPESTSFNKISQYPDYLLHIKREDLDTLISDQKEALENCSKFVMEDGLLIYIVDTLSKKESTLVINDFINKHPEFSLIEQKQYFPYENDKSSMFYAVFKLKGALND